MAQMWPEHTIQFLQSLPNRKTIPIESPPCKGIFRFFGNVRISDVKLSEFNRILIDYKKLIEQFL